MFLKKFEFNRLAPNLLRLLLKKFEFSLVDLSMWGVVRLHTCPFAGRTITAETHRKLLDFYKNPTAELFNQVVDLVGDLYTIEESKDEPYVLYAGEKFESYCNRIKKPPETKIKYKYTDPLILIWIYAAAKKYPWIAEACDRPLVIERAILFYNKSYQKLVFRLEEGPRVYDSKREHWEDDRPGAKISIYDWRNGLYHYLDQTIMMFGATGHKSLLESAKLLAVKFDEDSFIGDATPDTHADYANAGHTYGKQILDNYAEWISI